MKANHLTQGGKKGGRFLRALLIMEGVEQQEVAQAVDASEALVSQVVHGHRKGTKRNGKKIMAIKKAFASRLNRRVEDLFPDDQAA